MHNALNATIAIILHVNKIVLGGKYQSVNVRREPRDGDTIIGSQPRGVVMETVGETKDYYQVIAYVRKDAASPYSPPSQIPWVSQVARANPGAQTANDCQQACLSMIYEWKTGLPVAPDQVTRDLQIHPSWYELNGNWMPGKYTTIQQGVNWLNWRGISARRVFLQRGVLPALGSVALIAYSRLAPHNAYDKAFYRSADAFHFVVFLEGDEQTVRVHDPLWYHQSDGASREWSRQEWNAAFTGSTIGV